MCASVSVKETANDSVE
ncbi:hypothetical protein TFKS16_0499 [Tannerella forsythia KS16]|nr:hypothetical protein TFKS16_0499 [Tannerella forsythia KS16]